MNKFGVLKTKILQKLTEAYSNGNKSEIKKILTTVTKNKDFRDIYLFYEEIENKYIEDKEDAKMYLNEMRHLLIDKLFLTEKFNKSLDKKIGDVTITENELYSNLDTFIEKHKLRNADKWFDAQKKLIDHLTTKKETPELVETTYIKNENLLHSVLTNNFNVLYSNTLNEEQQDELKKILEITNEELKNNFKILKTEVIEKMHKIQTEGTNDELNKKLNEALTETTIMDVSKFNYYKLLQLKNGI